MQSLCTISDLRAPTGGDEVRLTKPMLLISIRPGFSVISKPNTMLLALVICGGFGLTSHVHSQSLKTRRANQVSLSDADARKNLSDASNALQKKDYPDDVACNVTLTLDGSV